MANLFDLLNHINFTEEDLEEIDGALDRVIETINSKAEENWYCWEKTLWEMVKLGGNTNAIRFSSWKYYKNT